MILMTMTVVRCDREWPCESLLLEHGVDDDDDQDNSDNDDFTVQYRPVQSNTSQYSPITPSTTQYSPVTLSSIQPSNA